MKRLALLAALFLFAQALAACDDSGSKAEPCNGDCDLVETSNDSSADTDPDAITGEKLVSEDAMLCVGIRGNGELIFSHFASLARILEEYGLIDGAAGGSSGSISMFLLESVLSNPAVYDCGGRACTHRESATRAAFLMKSLQAYLLVLSETDEAKAFLFILPLIAKFQEAGISELANTDLDAARTALNDVLNSPDVADLVNDEVLDLLANSPSPLWHAEDIIGALANFGAFDATDPSIFIRPGLLDFGQLARKIGRIANFYAAVGPADLPGLGALLDACAEPGRGLDWVQVAELDAGNGESCSDALVRLMSAYRAALLPIEGEVANRVDQLIGQTIPCLVSTSVLEGDAVTKFQEARTLYLAAQPYTLNVSFDDIVFGYWGPENVLATVQSNPKSYTDLKTQKFRSLGQTTWGEAMSFSPAEPGLARAKELNATQVSAGGWSDLHPTLVLNNMGCDKVVYLTRKGKESGFATGVATLLGMSAAQGTQLYDLEAQSAFRLSIEEADGVWCTNWNDFSGTDVVAISADGFSASFETSDPLMSSYPNASTSLAAPGCSPGVPAP
ncbi:MAG: hypothetical protein AUK47_26235 [Deltaproteobacteria bacterium CG2_30_63_29]|nr:MAG: hypothetical protein AUK47_26235 [Deltaproteobacteria bacterium CG2_30_63_29]PJB49174.1 MAG: hypothetical protein CO108_00640 [Deltaproteobacteria bacterium CG_4_9_14_3_um_filter_63_12]